MAQTAPPTGLPGSHLHDRHTELGLSGDDLVGMYRTILLARRLDQRIWTLNRMGRAPLVVSSQGHEGVHVGSAWAVAPARDVVLPYYRDLGVVLTLGMTPYDVLLGVLAKPADPSSGGRQMPSHWGCKRLGIVSGSSAIATHLPHAVGMAKAAQLRGEDEVVVCYFADAALSQGDFHESCNVAGTHGLPVVFVCETDGPAPALLLAPALAADGIAELARAHGLAGMTADGNEPLDVYAAAQRAVRRARDGEGPTLVACTTYRGRAPASGGDDAPAATPEEIEPPPDNDPVGRMQQYLFEQRLLSQETEMELDAGVEGEIDQAVARAEAAPEAVPDQALTRIFARPLGPLRGVPAGAGDLVVDQPAERVPDGGAECTILDTVRQVQHDLLAGDDRVVILGEGVGPRGGLFRSTDGLYATFGGDRVIDTPPAESSIVGIAIGLALAGMRPIAEIQFADLLHSAFDQLVNEAAKLHYRSNGDLEVPMVVRAPWGGGVHGGLYHSQAVEAFYAHVAGLKVLAPSTPADVAGLLRAAVADPDPVLFLEHKKTYRLVRGPVPDGDWTIPIGKAAIARPGRDATIVTYGLHRHLAVEAANILAAGGGPDVEVVDLRTISPLDHRTILDSASRTGRVLVVHEDNVSFGVGAEVAAIVAEEAFYDLDAPVRRLAMPDVPAMPFAGPLEQALLITTARIVEAARHLCDH